jgi:hypothetical protein
MVVQRHVFAKGRAYDPIPRFAGLDHKTFPRRSLRLCGEPALENPGEPGLVDKPLPSVLNDEGTLPRVPGLPGKPIATALAEQQGEFLVNLFLQFERVGTLRLLEDSFQMLIDLFLRLKDHSVKVRVNPDMGHIGQTARRKIFGAPMALPSLHRFSLPAGCGNNHSSPLTLFFRKI